jgi:hypothetical protein
MRSLDFFLQLVVARFFLAGFFLPNFRQRPVKVIAKGQKKYCEQFNRG